MSKNGNANGLADPSRLKPLDPDDDQIIKVIVETPKGYRNKYAFDPDEQGVYVKEGASGRYGFPLMTLDLCPRPKRRTETLSMFWS